jgi:SAM-dependent methyltransferase
MDEQQDPDADLTADKHNLADTFPSINRFARDVGLPAERMAEAFALEREFHRAILSEPSAERRRALYNDIYTRVFAIYGFEFKVPVDPGPSPRDALVRLLMPELRGRAILDVGCGAGEFLFSCSRLAEPTRLVGIDVFAQPTEIPERRLSFLRKDVVNFSLFEQFDVAMSDNVYEHIAPQDAPAHLASIRLALRSGGTLIVLTPNRLFGPWDVTRIFDDSYSGRISAQGTHVNETTFSEILPRLAAAGFGRFRSLVPTARSRGHLARRRVPTRLLAAFERIGPLTRRLQAMQKRDRLTDFEISLIATAV